MENDGATPEKQPVLTRERQNWVRAFERRVYAYGPMMQAIDRTSLRIDSAGLAEFNQTWGLMIVAALSVLLLVFGLPAHLVGCTLLAAMGAAPIALLWRGGPTGIATLRTALGVSAFLPPLWMALTLAAGTFVALRLQRT